MLLYTRLYVDSTESLMGQAKKNSILSLYKTAAREYERVKLIPKDPACKDPINKDPSKKDPGFGSS